MVSLKEWQQPTVARFCRAVEQKEESSYLTNQSILTQSQHKISLSKSDSSLNALAEEKATSMWLLLL